jgi:hypothetical protein
LHLQIGPVSAGLKEVLVVRTAVVLVMLSFALVGCLWTEDPELHLSGPYVLRNAFAGGSTYLAYRQGESTIGRVQDTVVAAGVDEKHVIVKRHPNGNAAVTEYYIVDRSKDRFYAEPSVAVVGPLDVEQFSAKRREMNVSPALGFTVDFQD